MKDNGKRAVLVSFHGSSRGRPAPPTGRCFDGSQLSLLGDVVVVTVNHRLASFGYTHLAAVSGARKNSRAQCCSVRWTCVRASLEWVRDNIATFGGDPSRVMIFRPVRRRLGKIRRPQARRPRRDCSTAPRCPASRRCVLPNRPDAEEVRNSRFLSRNSGLEARPRHRDPASAVGTTARTQGGIGFAPVMDGRYLPDDPLDSRRPQNQRQHTVAGLDDARGRGALLLTNWNITDAGLTTLLNERSNGKADRSSRSAPR